MNIKLRCILLDDELSGLTYLKLLCEQIQGLEVVRAFNNPETFLKEFPNLDFDFCILDIEMPGMNGLQVANILSEKPVVFATAYKEYAAQAFDLNAVDYIRKPIQLERLKQAVSKVARVIHPTRGSTDKVFVQLNTNKGKALIFFEDVAYIKTSDVDSRDKVAVLFNDEEFVLKNISFGKILEIFPGNQFCRINKKEIVSLRAVQVSSFDEIITYLTNAGKPLKLFLSDKYRRDFLKKVKS